MQKGSGVSGEGELKIRDQRDFTGTSHVSLFHQLFTAGGTKYPLYMKPTTDYSTLPLDGPCEGQFIQGQHDRGLSDMDVECHWNGGSSYKATMISVKGPVWEHVFQPG